jgi:hypothetical protein
MVLLMIAVAGNFRTDRYWLAAVRLAVFSAARTGHVKSPNGVLVYMDA